MASNRSYTLIGAFLLGALVLVAVGILTFGNTGLFKQQRQAIIFFNQSVLGLTNGSRVLFRGVQVGTVRRVQLRLNPQGGARIAVTIDMSGNDLVTQNGQSLPSDLTIQQMVKRGLRAQLVVYSYVTSQLAVNLDFEPKSTPNFVVPPGQLSLPEIPAVPSELSKLKNTVAKLPWKQTLKHVDKTMRVMTHLAKDMDQTIQTLGPSLNRTSESTQAALKAVRQALAQNSQQIKSTLSSIKQLADQTHSVLNKRNTQVAQLLDSARKTSQHLSRLSKNLAQLSSPDSATRQDIDSTLRDLSAAASSLRGFADQIQRNPHSLLYGGSQ